MRIKKLRLTGFKSFVEPSELRIEPGLTGVVGPNGCGKSNLLEAIRWVMGESSPKSMRGGGMEDVIFAGTSTRPAREFAEVALVCDTDGIAIPGVAEAGGSGDLEVIRRIERGAGSAYRANGRDVRAKDVALIFADAATGAHSPALVSQGKVASIINAKPQERRQLLEEAAGISGLHVRRKDAEQKLRATETNLARLADVLGDMENRANALRRQARAAERYIKLSDQIRVAEGRMIFSRWRDAAAASDKAKEDASAADQAVTVATSAQTEATRAQAAAAEAMMEARHKAQQSRDAERDVAQRLHGLQAEQNQLVRRLGDLQAERTRLIDDSESEGSTAREAVAAIERLEIEATNLAADMERLEARRPELQDRLTKATATLRDAEVTLAQARAQAAGEAADRRIADAAVATATTRQQRVTAEIERLESSHSGDRDALLTQQHDSERAVQDAEQAFAAAEARATETESAREAAVQALAAHDSALAEARAALAALEGEASALERALRSAAHSGPRLVNAIKVQAGYEAALAAALGDELEAGFGDVAEGWRGASPGDTDPALPHGVRSLADVVNAPAEVLRRLTQVGVVDGADDLIHVPLAVGQRVVSRDGHLRRWDGFWAHGQGAATAEQLARRNRLDALSSQIPEVRAGIHAIAERQISGRSARDAAHQDAIAARQAVGQADAARRAALRQVDTARGALEHHDRGVALTAARLAELRTEEQESSAALNSAQTALAALPAGDASVARVTAGERATEAARSAMQEARDAESQLDRSIGTARERSAVITAEINGWRGRAGEAERRIEAMNSRVADLQRELERDTDRPEQLASSIAELEAQRSELSMTADDSQANERAAEEELRMRDARLNDTREALSVAREARAGAAARAEHAELRRVEMGRVSSERFECPPPMLPEKLEFDEADVGDPANESQTHERLVADRERIGPVNLVAAQELAELEQEHAANKAESEELQLAVNRLRGSIGSLNREGRQRLLEAFETVNGHFRTLFTTLFGGGQAHLELIESDDPLEAGLEIMAQPPGKKLSALTLLSGGEQALTAIALIFGLFLTNPAPICVLDEVDAPLDDANVERFCDLLDRMVGETNTRYLIVTHNAVTMARMHRLFGVTMVERGVSRLVSVDLGGAEQLLAAE